MARVFLSYTRSDAAVAEHVRAALVDGGHDVWVDHEQAFPPPTWRAAVADALAGVDVVVFVVSARSLASEACREELDQALWQATPIVPVRARDVAAGRRDERLDAVLDAVAGVRAGA
jgi:hypothetical protein